MAKSDLQGHFFNCSDKSMPQDYTITPPTPHQFTALHWTSRKYCTAHNRQNTVLGKPAQLHSSSVLFPTSECELSASHHCLNISSLLLYLAFSVQCSACACNNVKLQNLHNQMSILVTIRCQRPAQQLRIWATWLWNSGYHQKHLNVWISDNHIPDWVNLQLWNISLYSHKLPMSFSREGEGGSQQKWKPFQGHYI